MADRKVTDHTALTGASLATGDLFEVVDISDTTDGAGGTNKKMTTAEKIAGLKLHGSDVPLWGFRSGQYYSSYDGNGTFPGVSGELYCVPFYVPVTTTFDRIGMDITTLGTAGVTRLGIYNDGGAGVPTTVVLDAGTIDTSATGNKLITISQQLTPGLYWLAHLCETAGGTVYRNGATMRLPMSGSGSISSTTVGGLYKTGVSSGSIPASPASLAVAGLIGKVMLRAA